MCYPSFGALLLKNIGDTMSYGFCFMLHIWGLEEHCLDGVYGLDGEDFLV